MKFNSLDVSLQNSSFNTSELIHIDEIRENTRDLFPAFIFKGGYIKTITRIPGIDFLNLTATEQNEVVQYWSQFLTSIKVPTQVFIRSKQIDTNTYEKQVLEQVKNTPYLNDKIKALITKQLPMALDYIKGDSGTTPFVKEYYIVTSCTPRFSGNLEEDQVNEDDSKPYYTGKYNRLNTVQYNNFCDAFNDYYQELMGPISSLCNIDSEKFIEPLSSEEEIVGLLAELTNGIPAESIDHIRTIM